MLFAEIGNNLDVAACIGDEASPETEVNGKIWIYATPIFGRVELCGYLSTLSKLIDKADTVAVTLYRQFQSLSSAMYPADEIMDENPPSYATYREGHLIPLQDLDNEEESSDFSETFENLADCCDDVHCSIEQLRSMVEEIHCDLKTKAPAPV